MTRHADCIFAMLSLFFLLLMKNRRNLRIRPSRSLILQRGSDRVLEPDRHLTPRGGLARTPLGGAPAFPNRYFPAGAQDSAFPASSGADAGPGATLGDDGMRIRVENDSSSKRSG